MTLLLLACATSAPTWSDDAVLGGARARLDADGDGHVEAGEYEAHRWNGPPFATADADGDGDLSAPELAELLVAQGPGSFDGAQVAQSRGGAVQELLSREQRQVWETLVWLGDTLRAHGLPGPDPAAVERAVATGSMTSPETLGVLEAVRGPWTAHGWAWPYGDLPAGIDAAMLPKVALVEADPNAAVAAGIRARFDWGGADGHPARGRRP